uniref:Phosphoinositide phospholipase C n=1 Tax=Pelodiscus sinensis TaxID=13735 RepID=K7F2W5_PELSI
CRCVELDCWEGPNGEPVIYHGHTLTSKILFRDAIESIRAYAFQHSAYPVILSLENHCGPEQQATMARHMRAILGDMLLTQTLDGLSPMELPSPEQLKGKILVKGKKLPDLECDPKNSSVLLESNGEEEEEEEERMLRRAGRRVRRSRASPLWAGGRAGPQTSWGSRLPFPMSSFSERAARTLIKESGTGRQAGLPRPWGPRDTAGLGLGWVGCRALALPMEQLGGAVDVRGGCTGGAGRELKGARAVPRPAGTSGEPSTPPLPWLCSSALVSRCAAPHGPGDRSVKGSPLDSLGFHSPAAVKSDRAGAEGAALWRHMRLMLGGAGGAGQLAQPVTLPVPRPPGFNPRWEETLSFQLQVPELALVRFVVEDYDTTSCNDFVGQFTLPFSCLREGYRHVHLLSRDGASLAPATLFVHVQATK